MTIKEKAKQLKADIPAVFLALKDRQTPWYAKMLAAVTVCYALSPIDLVPDFIPVLGYLDDLILLPLLVSVTIRCIPQPVWQRSRTAAKEIWKNGKPKKWFCALPVALIWLVLLGFAAKLIFG